MSWRDEEDYDVGSIKIEIKIEIKKMYRKIELLTTNIT
jgi:hypothetical protein